MEEKEEEKEGGERGEGEEGEEDDPLAQSTEDEVGTLLRSTLTELESALQVQSFHLSLSFFFLLLFFFITLLRYYTHTTRGPQRPDTAYTC